MFLRFPFALALCAGIATACAAEPPRLLEAPVTIGPARTVDLPSNDSGSTILPVERREIETPRPKPVTLGRPQDARPLADDDLRQVELRTERAESFEPTRKSSKDDGDFLNRRSGLSRERDDRRTRSSEKFGDKLRDWLAPGGGRDSWLFSDHAFDQFASPISNPFLAEDPRALTEIRPIFLYQKIPGEQPNFQGGDAFFFGGRASLALSERISFTVNKLGATALNPSNKDYGDSEFGFAELWLGPKFTFYRDPQSCTVMAAGAIFQIPTGPEKIFQDTGNLSIVPYVSAGKTLTDLGDRGSLNGLFSTGYAFSTNDERSEYFYLSAHLDFDVRNNHRLYPVLELNYFQYAKDGSTQRVSGQGHDLFNFGSKSNSASLVTGAIGGRYKITEAAQIGGAFELPLFGNKDVFQYRFTMDVIFRY